ncbi:MAG: hypothetical protein SF182_28350 [Deltaproteobacteria bacterium]|nr:hypothetical protein [Deltaproteobacteria bacterium]
MAVALAVAAGVAVRLAVTGAVAELVCVAVDGGRVEVAVRVRLALCVAVAVRLAGAVGVAERVRVGVDGGRVAVAVRVGLAVALASGSLQMRQRHRAPVTHMPLRLLHSLRLPALMHAASGRMQQPLLGGGVGVRKAVRVRVGVAVRLGVRVDAAGSTWHPCGVQR